MKTLVLALMIASASTAQDFRRACQAAAAERFGAQPGTVGLSDAPSAPDGNRVVNWSVKVGGDPMKGHCLADAKNGKLLWMETGSYSAVQPDAGGSKTVNGSITGYDTTNYAVKLRAGQQLTIKLATKNGSTYFNLIAPAAEEAMHDGSALGNSFSGAAKTAGDYRVKVYMMRNEARRKRTVPYALTIDLGK